MQRAKAVKGAMTDQPYSNEVALRIGLAVRHLPTITLPDFIEALHNFLGDHIDEQTLNKITVTNLKHAFRQSVDIDGDEDREDFSTATIAGFKEAVRILWGDTHAEEIPALDAYQEGDMPGSVRVAVASNTGEQLDGHFGSSLRFLIYQVSGTEVRLIELRSTLEADLAKEKIVARVQLISDCAVLYTMSIGGPAAARVTKAKIHVMAVPEGGLARDALQKLQAVLRHKAPPWLAKLRQA
jgi:nitrogen fixation protein NifX